MRDLASVSEQQENQQAVLERSLSSSHLETKNTAALKEFPDWARRWSNGKEQGPFLNAITHPFKAAHGSSRHSCTGVRCKKSSNKGSDIHVRTHTHTHQTIADISLVPYRVLLSPDMLPVNPIHYNIITVYIYLLTISLTILQTHLCVYNVHQT